MLIDTEILDIKKWADDGDPNCQLLMFWLLVKGEKVKKDENQALRYLTEFVQNAPQISVRSILEINKIESDTLGDEALEFFQYTFHITTIGIFLFEQNKMKEAALWFKKSIDLANEFLRYKDDVTREKYTYQESAYQYWQDVLPYFDDKEYKKFNLRWETEFYSPSTTANQNGLKSL